MTLVGTILVLGVLGLIGAVVAGVRLTTGAERGAPVHEAPPSVVDGSRS